MKPFGLLLRFYRNERGIKVKVIARRIGVTQKALYAIESGRQRPPQGKQFDTLCNCLCLNPTERQNLQEAVECSVSHVRIPYEATPAEYRLAHELFHRLGKLTHTQIESISATLNGHFSKSE